MEKKVCVGDEISRMFDEIDRAGFKWNTPIFIKYRRFWKYGEKQPAYEPCPNCKRLSDQTFNVTDLVDRSCWLMQSCTWCRVKWFWFEDAKGSKI